MIGCIIQATQAQESDKQLEIQLDNLPKKNTSNDTSEVCVHSIPDKNRGESNDESKLTNKDSSQRKHEADQINQLFSQIETLAQSEVCLDASEWNFISYGDRACGGPEGYIAYSNGIDTALFRSKIEAHKKAQKEFNHKWSIGSICAVAPKPRAIYCNNGKAVLRY